VGNGGIATLIFDPGNRWKYVVSLIPQPPHPQVKSCGAHRQGNWMSSRAGVGNEEKVLPPLGMIELRVSGHLARSLVATDW